MRIFLLFSLVLMINIKAFAEKQVISAIGIPLADHYPAIIAYEKYKDKMVYADFKLKLFPGPELVRAYFRSKEEVDIAFNVSPMVMDMFRKQPNFRWVSLIHRDGNALAINTVFNKKTNLPINKSKRLPDNKVADALSYFKKQQGKPIEAAIPSPLATHTTILYKYLKEHGKKMGNRIGQNVDVLLRIVKPPKSPLYMKKQGARFNPALFEQSLPWADVVESRGDGFIAWYSKDVMQHKHGPC